MSHQLIYRQERRKPFDVDLPPGCRFAFCSGIKDGLCLAAALLKRSGAKGSAINLLKLMTPSRRYTCLLDAGSIVSECYIVLSHCRHYDVELTAVVLGPVWTDPAQRGKGLATCLLKATMNQLLRDGHRIFYIDTSDQNTSMQRVIAHCGFREPGKKMPKNGPVS